MNLRSGIKKLALEFSMVVRTPIQPKQTKPVEWISSSLTRNDDIFSKNISLKEELMKENLNFIGFKYPMNKIAFSTNSCNFSVNILKTPLPCLKYIIEPDFHKKGKIEVPLNNTLGSIIEFPCNIEQEKIDPLKNVISKKAENMIKLRRRKMRKHKWKKLQKKMKFKFAKIRQRREIKKEYIFQSKLKEILKEGEKFSAEKYLNENLSKLNWKAPITKARGRLAPQWVIKQELERKEYNKSINERINECLEKTKLC